MYRSLQYWSAGNLSIQCRISFRHFVLVIRFTDHHHRMQSLQNLMTFLSLNLVRTSDSIYKSVSCKLFLMCRLFEIFLCFIPRRRLTLFSIFIRFFLDFFFLQNCVTCSSVNPRMGGNPLCGCRFPSATYTPDSILADNQKQFRQ